MMSHVSHTFLFKPGKWEGVGTITLSLSPTVLQFKTQWHFNPEQDGQIHAVHFVSIEGTDEPLKNTLRFFDFKKDSFQVELQNEIIGLALGKGIIDDNTLGWEFRNVSVMDGFELFHKGETEADGYRVHAEYVSPDKCHSTIDAQLHTSP